MTTQEQGKAPTLAEAFITQQIDLLKSAFPPYPAPSPFQKTTTNKLYSKAVVKELIYEVIGALIAEDMDMRFESWLNDQGLNGNGGANEDKYEEFESEFVDSFIE